MKKAFIAVAVSFAFLTACTDSSTVKVPKGQHVYSDILLNNADGEASTQYANEIEKSKEKTAKEEVEATPVAPADSTAPAESQTAHEAHDLSHDGSAHSNHKK
jgi:hypothetical protein